jgi:Cys-tRNA(Pro)/Cys-tRNA(Cys) deacylase
VEPQLTPAVDALTRAGIRHTVHHYAHDPRSTSYGLEAATALGLDPDRVFKTLMAILHASAGSGLVVAVVPVSARLDLKALARAAGGSKAELADVRDAERATGYVAGGISPFGQRRAHATVVDETALLWDTVFVSAGRRGLDVELAPTDLVEATGASLAEVSRW